MDAATKAALIELVEGAQARGWTLRRAASVLGIDETRIYRWMERRAEGTLEDRAPGGGAVHGLLDEEVEQILAVYREWGEVDRSHRKLAHRGSYLGRVWVSPSSVLRVLAAQGLVLPGIPRPAAAKRSSIPDWASYVPNSIWLYDATHFPRARQVAFAMQDMVSRKWIHTVVSAEETSTQVQVLFVGALEAEGLWERVEARMNGSIDLAVDDPSRPILLALSDNGPQMTSGSTREFLAMCAIVQHFGRPGCPADQAWVESLFGHVKAEWPHLEAIRDPDVLEAELARARHHHNHVRLHAGIGYVTPHDEHTGRGEAIRRARVEGLKAARERRLAYHRRERQTTRQEEPE